jgi:hypothetical protein
MARAFVRLRLLNRALHGVKHEELRVRETEGPEGAVDGALPAHRLSPARETGERAFS